MKTIKSGMKIINVLDEFTVLVYAAKQHTNLALLIRSADGMFVTVRNLSIYDGHKTYSWDWGHYFTDLHEALCDYDVRLKE
jgi:hypothetical protein